MRLLLDATARHPRGWTQKQVEEAKERLLKNRFVDDNGCWVWTLSRIKEYGQTQYMGRTVLVHRLAYELWNGKIADDLVIDHVKPQCQNTLCFNPEHLEAVLPIENYKRSDCRGAINLRTGFCKRGHPWIAENIIERSGRRRCKSCLQEWYASRRKLFAV